MYDLCVVRETTSYNFVGRPSRPTGGGSAVVSQPALLWSVIGPQSVQNVSSDQATSVVSNQPHNEETVSTQVVLGELSRRAMFAFVDCVH